jgi:hemoglobin
MAALCASVGGVATIAASRFVHPRAHNVARFQHSRESQTMKHALVALALLALLGCAGMQEKSASPSSIAQAGDSLYRELGSTDGITRVVDVFLQRINADARINTLFRTVDHDDLRRLVIEQLCAATGGPCKYTGRSMEEAHSGLNLTDADFKAFVEDLVAAMNELKVAKPSQKKLLALLTPMKPQIVGQ